MNKVWENRWLPIMVAVVLFLTYAFADGMFVQCLNSYFCKAINTGNISQVTASDDKDLTKIPDELEKKYQAVDTKAGEVNAKNKEVETKNKEIVNKQTAIDDKDIQIEQTENEELKTKTTKEKTVLEKEKAKLDNELKNLNTELTNLTDEQTIITDKILSIRSQVSSRYASRMTWVFLTGSFFLLCLAAMWVSFTAIKESVEQKKFNLWIGATAVIAIGFAAFVFWNKENYMSIVLPMFNQSVFKYGDVSVNAVNFFNVFGFAATICLVSASSAILSGILRTKVENSAVPPPNPLGTFEKYEENIKKVLYVGALMLFVGMLRIQLLSDWHLTFISTTNNQLLADFFKSSIGVQAFFYTILLAVIYLPVAYSIERKPPTEGVTPGFFEKLGLPFSGDFLTRLVAVISPFLAGPLIKLFEFLANKAS